MKIKDLDQHCGECIIAGYDYCGNPFGFCLCCDERFSDMEESEYIKIAETAKDIKRLDVCEKCQRPECGSYRYSDEDFADEPCEHDDEARDHYCEQIAAYVKNTIMEE